MKLKNLLNEKRYKSFEIEKSAILGRPGFMIKLIKANGEHETSFAKTKSQAEKDAKMYMKMEAKISRKEMNDVKIFADAGTPSDRKKWKVSKRAAKRKFGEATSEAKTRYAQKHYRESGGSFR
jgi:hypothetical protein